MLICLAALLALLPLQFCFRSNAYFGAVSSRKRLQVTPHYAKSKSDEVFVCSECGVEHINWVGQCTSCKEWNCVKPFRVPKLNSQVQRPLDIRTRASSTGRPLSSLAGGAAPAWLPSTDYSGNMVPMNTVDVSAATFRHALQSEELNRVLGGGLVKGSTVLLAGEPGIGKSTLMIQLAHNLASSKLGAVVYISGEENPQQIAARAARLKLRTDDIFVLCDVDMDRAVQTISDMSMIDSSKAPALIIVDSVQTMRSGSSASAAGSVAQIRDSTAQLVQLAKLTGSAVLIAGHVTKSGEVAGPRILEHMVDTVLYMEGNEQLEHRLLRSVKNRFGSTSEVGVFAMTEAGLEDVHNPSEIFLSPDNGAAEDGEGAEGACVAVLMEGSRPLLSEIQCLVNGRPELPPGANSKATPARRAADGFPLQRLQLICAVIEKRLQLPLWNKDVYLNVVGGLRVSEPSADLAVAMSIVSSALEEPIRHKTAFIGEIGLGGELRGGKRLDDRIREAQKMGFKRIIVPKAGATSRIRAKHDYIGNPSSASAAPSDKRDGVVECRTLYDALAVAFVNPDVSKSLKNNRKKRKSPATAYGSTKNCNSAFNVQHSVDNDDNSHDEDESQHEIHDNYL